MRIYLAGPFFNDKERENIEKAKTILRNKGFDVFVPMEHKIENGENMPNDEWGKAVFEMDKNEIKNCNVMVVMYYGLYSDSGTAWECGYDNCLNIPILIVHCMKMKNQFNDCKWLQLQFGKH
jgi:nucleoside 2-deoxyribosyltransferase